MYYYMSLCNIPFLDFSQTTARICFKFCVDVPWMDPTTFVKIGVLPLFSWNYGQFCAIFGQFLKNLLQKH